MELLDQLEHEVQTLIRWKADKQAEGLEIDALKARVHDLEAENQSLAEALELERRNSKAVLARVDALLTKLRAERESVDPDNA
ncbi:MAG: hypothetical protein IJD04_03440 [Desulfovibrionaceae bacterium]|nr:hypothetical protein [Desulfovibrionaceae bacterium]